MVEHGTENAGVDSSSLSLGTITILPLNSVAKRFSAQPAILLFADIFQRRRITTELNVVTYTTACATMEPDAG